MIHSPTDQASKNLPLSSSESPYNAYYLKGCEVVNRSPAYASCLTKINRLNEGFPMTYCEECNTAIRKGKCDAVGMRQQETLAGVALFFQPSQSYRGKNITNLTAETELPISLTDNRHIKPYTSKDSRAANYEGRYSEYIPKFKGQKSASEENTKESITSQPANIKSKTFEVDGYAAAINQAMRELDKKGSIPSTTSEPSTPVTKPTLISKPEMLDNESPLQYARRIAALRQLQTA